ncbi:MAG: two-component regulator propeller domain-containing protein [Bacteroidota bacterium]
MSIIKFFFAACLVFGFTIQAQSQENIPLGTWRAHLSFNNALRLEIGESRVACATSNGIFFLDREDNSLTQLSEIDGLSDVNITALGINPQNDQLIIGYEDGNIDIINGNEIINFDFIRNTDQITGSKQINHFTFNGDLTYISTDFGVVLFDTQRFNIVETYREIGPNGEMTVVNESVLLNDSIYLATQLGVIAGRNDGSVSLLDFNNWRSFGPIEGIPDEEVEHIIAAGSDLLASINDDAIYQYTGQNWEPLSTLQGEDYSSLDYRQGRLLVTTSQQVWLIEGTSINEIENEAIEIPNEAVLDEDLNIWIADGVNGLVSNFVGGFQTFFPSGPFSNNSWALHYSNNKVYAVAGGVTESNAPLNIRDGFYVFENGSWSNFNAFTSSVSSTTIPEFRDIIDVTRSSSLGKTYFASFGFGLLESDESSDQFNVIDENTPGSPLVNLNPNFRQVRVTALASNQEGLWVTNFGASNSLHLLEPDGNWRSFFFGSFSSRFPLDIEIANNNDKWISLNINQGGGILVFDNENNVNRLLTDEENQGGLPSMNVTALAKDKDGFIWVGTDRGVAFFANPQLVLGNNAVNALRPIFENRPLLRSENITAIAIDGGNRKWIGTDNGVWLFNEDGESQVFNFTQENSPLLSDNVRDIAIHQETGEVFFATDRGIISFRGTATEGTAIHQNVKIFPNPVTPDFNGLVGISGLAIDAVVKITDISGKLIWETRSNGGTATWNTLGLNGERASTGVYLVFSSTEDGEDTFVGKIAVVN